MVVGADDGGDVGDGPGDAVEEDVSGAETGIPDKFRLSQTSTCRMMRLWR